MTAALQTAPASGAALSVQGLRHEIRAGEILVSAPALEIPPGRLTLLTGPSGSGKTTLLYLLAGLARPTAGRVIWDGEDLAAQSEGARDAWRRRRASFVFQDFHLIPELSPVENVLTPLWFSSFSAKAQKSRAEALLKRFGVPERRRAAVLSRGEQQRTALARALISSPAVVFADEPTASLDVASGAEVAATLRSLAREEGRSVIVASHDPALIALADVHIRLERGAPVEVAL